MGQTPKVFIDGEAGTTGLQIYTRLSQRDDIELLSIDPDKRKDAATRSQLINSADVAILCLPDAAAKEAVSFVSSPTVKILDASTAHRTAGNWIYGFPELKSGQREAIAHSRWVSNPGCYPTGFLACLHPLIATNCLPETMPITINAISGYSGGGKKLIEQYETAHAQNPGATSTQPYGIYGLKFGHKHVKEMHQHSGLAHPPLFVPAVGDFAQGMLVQIPLPLWTLSDPPTGDTIHGILSTHYQNEPFITVMPLNDTAALRNGNFLDSMEANETNLVQIFVFANDETQETLLIARLDNLGKGASGAAVQNLNIMLGYPEDKGLSAR
ncbi:MAG: N-acetyl-gamma-glutamyl-phosphate reductase [Merismopedia sp. SIO2A8]|nr:N-acetyl-gamma-glutamyl-phosphate reductase [Merismopedia sp. SIO2A8]